ncbi:hypothetical protein AURDEDRAFT_168773 [Auricularia subglabra TFB-10046 SS5]|nr:hypothetical protein AURDEDRAFT_168773 [Auricularia subglabra TFB-10046 SS5]
MKADLDGLTKTHDSYTVQLGVLERERLQCKADITDLSAQRDLLKLSIARRPATLLPGAPPAVPDEILGTIFKLAIDGLDLGIDEHGQDLVAPKRTKQPFLCAAVCQGWRRAALGMASLWTYIGVDRIPRGPSGGRWQDIVRVMLQRSGMCGLQIVVVIPDDFVVYRHYQAILSDIMRHSSRCKHLSLSCDDVMEDARMEMLGLLRTRTPLLESVSFTSAYPCQYESPNHPPEYLPYAPKGPKARTVFLTATSLALEEIPYGMNRLAATLASFPALTSLELMYNACQLGAWASGSTIRVPELRSLIICLASEEDAGVYHRTFARVLEVLEAPRLRVLDLTPELLGDAAPLIKRCTPTIHELRLRNGSLNTLRELTFDWCELAHPFLNALCVVQDLEKLWPKLERIVLKELHECDDDQLLRFLQKRYPINAATPSTYLPLEVDIRKDNHIYGSVKAAEIHNILDT